MRKTAVLNLVLFALVSTTVLAADAAPSAVGIPVENFVNNAAGGPVLELVRPLFIRLSVLVGGIFGLYVILVAFRVYYERKNLRTLEAIRYDLDSLNESLGIGSSLHRKHILHQIVGMGKSIFKKKQIPVKKR